MKLTLVQESVDREWVQLLLEAKNIGVTLDEVKAYFQERKHA